MRRTIALIATVLTFAQPAVPAFANVGVGAVPRLSTSGSFTAPVGFQIFCLQNAQFCRGGGKSEIALTDAALKTLNSVNRNVNKAIRPTAERQDIWALGVTRGDCEDYVLAKRAQLITAGFPPSALRIAAVNTAQGIGHAVLVVRTTGGDLVLDNLTSQIKRSDQTNHRWVAMTEAN
ncbi:MAG: transglutaminase-like cysteine peptidase, partial [Anaerolineales bacterium]